MPLPIRSIGLHIHVLEYTPPDQTRSHMPFSAFPCFQEFHEYDAFLSWELKDLFVSYPVTPAMLLKSILHPGMADSIFVYLPR